MDLSLTEVCNILIQKMNACFFHFGEVQCCFCLNKLQAGNSSAAAR